MTAIARKLALRRQVERSTSVHLRLLKLIANGDRCNADEIEKLGQVGRVARTELESWLAIDVTREGVPLRLTPHGRDLLGALQGARP